MEVLPFQNVVPWMLSDEPNFKFVKEFSIDPESIA